MTSKQIKKFVKEFRKYMLKEVGRPCGHLGQDEINLDCFVCKGWLAYEFLSWFADNLHSN